MIGTALGELPRVRPSDLERRIALGLPFVVAGLAEAWPARTTFDHPHLLDVLGEATLPAGGLARPLPDVLARAVIFPPVTMHRPRPHVWLAPDGMTSPLHFDLPHNLNTVLRGAKEVLLFAPSESKNLYPPSLFQRDLYPSNSEVDLTRIDRRRFPKVEHASYWETTVDEGETLYIPPRYWHFVRSRGESVAVNVWFDRPGTLLERVRRKPLRLWAYDALARFHRSRLF